MKNNLLPKILAIKWEWQFRRKNLRLIRWIAIRSVAVEGPAFCRPLNHSLFVAKNSTTDAYFNPSDLKQTAEDLYNKCIQDSFVEEFELSSKSACERFLKACRPEMNKDLRPAYEEWIASCIELFRHIFTIRVFNKLAEERLNNFIISTIKPKAEQRRLFAVLSSTSKPNPFNDFHKAMEKAIAVRSNKIAYKNALNNIYNSFRWIPCGYADEDPWTKKDIQEQLEEFNPTKTEREDIRGALNEIRAPKEIRNLVKVIDIFVYYKDYYRRLYNYGSFQSRKFFTVFGKKYGLNFKQVKMLLPFELGKSKPITSDIMFSEKGVVHFMGRINIDKTLLSSPQQTICGTIANPGKVTGTVVIISSVRDLAKDCTNKILVAIMTTPEYTPGIKKCAAIVADEGGITCHAAIISRELGIPCIIGTKHATRVLKDGDIVEVDAFKGIVRRLK